MERRARRLPDPRGSIVTVSEANVPDDLAVAPHDPLVRSGLPAIIARRGVCPFRFHGLEQYGNIGGRASGHDDAGFLVQQIDLRGALIGAALRGRQGFNAVHRWWLAWDRSPLHHAGDGTLHAVVAAGFLPTSGARPVCSLTSALGSNALAAILTSAASESATAPALFWRCVRFSSCMSLTISQTPFSGPLGGARGGGQQRL